jgi:hypothetical protein
MENEVGHFEKIIGKSPARLPFTGVHDDGYRRFLKSSPGFSVISCCLLNWIGTETKDSP